MILIATHYWSNECEVTGRSSCYEEESAIALTPKAVGTSVFPNSDTEWLHRTIRLSTGRYSCKLIRAKGPTSSSTSWTAVFLASSLTRTTWPLLISVRSEALFYRHKLI